MCGRYTSYWNAFLLLMRYQPLPFCCFQEYSPDLTIALWVYTQGTGDMTILSNGIRTSATIGMFVTNETRRSLEKRVYSRQRFVP